MASSLTVTTMSRFLARGHSGGRSFSALSRPAPTSERRTPLESSRSLSLVAIRESIRDCYLGIAGSSPVTSLCDSLCFFHDWSGMPWWGVLTVVSLGGRTALLLPAKVVSEKTSVKRAFLFQEMDKHLIPTLRNYIKTQATKRNWSDRKAKAEFSRLQTRLLNDKIVEYNCAMSKVFIPMYLQIPIWLLMSIALRRMSTMMLAAQDSETQMRFQQFSNEGFLWVPDLTAPDPTFILPLMLGALYLANNEVIANNHPPGQKKPPVVTAVTNVLRVVSIAMIPIGTIAPSALTLYWCLSASAGLSITLTMMSPRVRNFFRIPEAPGEAPNPYRRVLENARTKVFKTR